MKRSLLIVFVALVAATTAFAQLPVGGSLSAYNDAEGLSCVIESGNAGNGITTIYIVHIPPAGLCVTGGTLRMVFPTCMSYVFDLGFSAAGPSVGTLQGGISIGYGRQVTAPFVAGSQSLLSATFNPDCCRLVVDLAAATDCGTIIQDIPAQGGSGVAAATGNPSNCTCDVDTQPSTWGGIKELFRTD